MFTAPTIVLDRLNELRVILIVVLKVVSHDVAHILNEVTVHLTFPTEHGSLFQVDLVKDLFPVLPLKIRFTDLVGDSPEHERPLDLLLLKTQNKLVVELTLTGPIGSNL